MVIITLMTDFGLEDPFVGIMKGIILSSIKDINIVDIIVDITHNLKCCEIIKASLFLSYYYEYFPEGTINIIVVDPLVGKKSIPILSIYKKRFFLAPDNGVLTPVLGEVYRIDFKSGDSNTFFGRDVYAPFAVKILKNDYKRYLKDYKNPIFLKIEEPRICKEYIKGKIIHIDKFCNLFTNIKSSLIKDDFWVNFKGKKIPIYKSYSDVEKGKCLSLINSFGLLEISINLGNAAKVFKADIDDNVYLIRRKNG